MPRDILTNRIIDETEWLRNRAHRKFQMVMQNNMIAMKRQGYEIGIEIARKEAMEINREITKEKGREIGMKEGMQKIATKLINMNLSVEQIQQATGLTPSEIEELRK
jgi:predicted transposase YdaD